MTAYETFRDAFRRTYDTVWRFMIPGNFHNGEGELVQRTEGAFLNMFAEACRQTAWLMFPSRAPADALVKIGADRGIPRGFSEPADAYRERLRAWRYPRGHRIRGNATGLLEQIAAVFGGAVEAQTIDARGTRYTWGEDGGTTVERGVSWDWDGEALTPNWARFWVVLQVEGATFPGTWDEEDEDEWDTPEESWASDELHPGQLAAVARLCRVGRLSWTPAGRRPIYCVIWFDGETYPAPDGTWDEWTNRPADMHAYFPLHVSIT